MVNGEVVQTIVSHGIFGWYGHVGWVNGAVDFQTILEDEGSYEIYGHFPGDELYEGCDKKP